MHQRCCNKISGNVQDGNDQVNAVAANCIPSQGLHLEHIWTELSPFIHGDIIETVIWEELLWEEEFVVHFIKDLI